MTTTETDLQSALAAIDARPNDPMMVLILADMLEDSGHPGAAGLRWAVDNGKSPMVNHQGNLDWWCRLQTKPIQHRVPIPVWDSLGLGRSNGKEYAQYAKHSEAWLGLSEGWKECIRLKVDPIGEKIPNAF